MGFDLLTEIYFRHGFFADNCLRDIRVLIPQDTAIDMRRYEILFRRMPDRFVLLFNNSNADQRAQLLRERLTLTFDLQLLDPFFYNYTGLPQTDIPGSILLFSNADGHAPGKLHKQDVIAATEVEAFKHQGAISVKPFGRIALQLTPDLSDSYEISFAARTTRWCYYLMSANLAALSEPAIVDTSNNIHFTGPQSVTLPDGARASVFVSEETIALAQRPLHTFQLVDTVGIGGLHRTVISALPSPDIQTISAAGIPGYDRTQAYSEIFLY
ncbi:hypothetical protein [Chitinophaga filiformis]|uniref:Uncharacterized protein n=1 Tax=Chitinophaga filiformis TaxID=104663 RepID=A0A1G7ZAM7_CHIFI|nr:hypothetical protein [Chitinophaga filiformis]SDH05791.1 hypothetical protein SAMN04488121_108200 [Chitinophaga filiformis]